MKSSPLVSVIVPNYNYAPYLKDRIDSILNQTYQDFELILLDDASNDQSADILYAYQDNPHVSHIIINKKNTGSPFQQWFKGIEKAQGEFIWIAESDDLCEPTLLAETVSLLKQHPQVAICFTGSTYIDENGKSLPYDCDKWYRKKHQPTGSFEVIKGKSYAEHNLYWRSYIANASSAVFRKSCFEKASPTACLQMRCSGDWLFWFKLAMQGDVIEVYKKLNYFRQHTQKVTIKSEINGEGKKEDIEIIYQMEQALPHIGRYKRIIRHGILYNRIKKLPATEDIKQKLYQLLDERLHSGAITGHLAHLNQAFRFLCPFILTMERDRV